MVMSEWRGRPKTEYDLECERLYEGEFDVVFRCPYDSLSCNRSVKGLRFGVCYVKNRDDTVCFVCSRFVAGLDVFRCSDGLPCNSFVDGFGFGACRDEKLVGKVGIVCPRFKPVV